MTRKHVERSPTQTAESCSYDPDSFAQLFAIEDRHFWFGARNKRWLHWPARWRPV